METPPNLTVKADSINKINELYELYANDDRMSAKLYHFITTYLPAALETDLKKWEKRNDKKRQLITELQLFTTILLSKRKFYYLPTASTFYGYDNKNYAVIQTDDIYYHLLKQLHTHPALAEHKNKTKKYVINEIKENHHLYNSVPESHTIQHILKMMSPLFLKTKQETKYFLTVIGDMILNPPSTTLYILPKQTKGFIESIQHIVCSTLNISNKHFSAFVYKYKAATDYADYRIININTIDFECYKQLFANISINFICVATHYSKRYGNAENYLTQKCDTHTQNRILYLKNNTIDTILDFFIVDFLDKRDGHTISSKDLLFIWKTYLHTNHFPDFIFLKTIGEMLKMKIEYSEEKDAYLNITSVFLPKSRNFLNFWKECIVEVEPTFVGEFQDEMEIDEICYLYHRHTNNTIPEGDAMKIIKYYFKHLTIEEDKYVLYITAAAHNKRGDIDTILDQYKGTIVNSVAMINIDDIYVYYTDCYKNSDTYIVNKRYFNKYVKYYHSRFIIYDTFLSTRWLFNGGDLI